MPTILAGVFFLLLAFLAGVATAYQPGINARFARQAGGSLWGGVANFAVGLVALSVLTLAARSTLPTPSRLASGPWWMWLGGLCGVFFVLLSIVLVPKVGTANYLVALVAGQLVASLVIDHFGHLGLAVREISAGRVLGVVLVFAGMLLVRYL